MTPYYQDDFCTIYNGDCREILPQLPKVDLVLTDPPYGINFAGQPTKWQRLEKCRHNRIWILAGGRYVWCYQCGALRRLEVIPNEKWVRPTGKNGENPALKAFAKRRKQLAKTSK